MNSLFRALLVLLAVAMPGCGLTTGPLSTIDTVGHDPAKIDADKTNCWLAAEDSAGGLHSRSRMMMMGAVGGIYHATSANPDELKTRDARIEQSAEACMLARGYTHRR